MKKLLLLISLTVNLGACNDNSFPVDYVFGAIDTGNPATDYLYGVKIDGTGERIRIPINEVVKQRMRCVTPKYYGEIMYWAGYKQEQTK